ncbi:uncharacterized protein LOC124158798 [Ischnura elegans]|uniref:uncharacterized protein LOC124158798 n=1 Tax=Ischnura elegans TaxID=197161 RepID=UPI001ED89C3A|nr:uncharacterized protein LOC124158798 [Ischnura elegans]
MTPAEGSRIKGSSAKDLEVPVVTPNRGIRLEEMAGGKSRGEKTDTEAIEERKSSHVHDASSSNEEGLREADKEKEGKVHKRRNAENLEVTFKKNVREGDEEGEEMEEEEEEEVGGKVTDEVVSSHVTGEDLKETAGVESENTELGNIPTGEESEENQWDGERRNSKSMYPPEDDVSSKFENKYSQEEKESIFGRRGSDKGKLTEAQSSGEWEFVDTGRHFAGNENSEDETFNEYEGRFPRDNFDGDSKGSFLHSLVGNRDSNQPLGVVGMGIELLHSLVDIPNREETVSTDGASPKREGEELFGVRMTLDDWDGRRGPNYSGSKAEVVVGELDLLDDWDHGVGRIGFIEIATDEHQENHLKDDYGVKMQIIEMEKEKCVEEMGEKDGDQDEISHVEGKSESTVIFTEKEVIAEDRESDVKQEKRGEDENHESTDDDDIEEIVRTEPDDWNRGTFTFTDSDHRSAFRNFEDLLGGDVSFKMTTCTAQFNLWPSEEAFGGKGTWMEHIDMDAFMSTAQSQQKPCSGKGLLEGMTTFAKTCVVGDEKGSTTTREQYYFTDDDEGGEMRKEILADGDEDDVVLVEQDFDDRSDEIEDNVGSASPWKSTYQSFDFSHMSHVRKGDAFAIFESPGVTTRATQDYEQLSDDEVADDESGKNWNRATLSGSEEMEMLDLSGDWEESVVFVDDDDGKSIPIGGRRGSGEYRKFENEIEGRVDSDLWGAMTLSNVDSCSGDTAFAIVMDSEDMKEKTPVLPTGRWCPRLPLLSPAMSAISEEESEEIYPEKYEKQDEESGSFQTDNEWDNQSSQDKAITREADDENLPDNTVLWEPSRESEGRGSGLENVTGGNEIQPTAIYTINLTPDETDTRSSPDENLEQGDAKHQLPKLDVEVEDGFGEPFSRRKSSSSSVLSETTTVEPMADCGAAFVVSSELAVALALGVSITQIIPPTMDQPEPPPLPQVELGTDALRAGHAREKERLEVRKSSISSTMNNTHVAQSNLSDEEQRTYSNEIVITTSDNSVSLKDIQSSTVSTKENNLGRKDDVDFLFPERNVSWYNEDDEEIVDWWRNQRLMTETLPVKEEVVDDKTELVTQEQPSENKEKYINTSVDNSINFLYPERNVSWYNDDEEKVVHWCYKERMATVKLSEEKETGCEKREPTDLPTTDIKEEINMAEKESIDFLFPERNVSWYNDDEEEVVHWCYKERMATVKLSEEKETGCEKREPTDLPTTDIEEEINMAEKESIDFLFPERNVSWYNDDEEEVVHWCYKERMATVKLSEEQETGCEKREPTDLPATDIKEENNMAEKESIDFLFPERNVSWYNDDEEEVVHWCYKERMATVKLSEEKEIGCEKREPTDLPTTDIKEENNMAEKESIDFLFPERNVNWYDDDQEEDFYNWSYMRPQTGTVVEEEKKEVKTTEEEKIIAFLDKERGNEKGRSAAPDEEVSAEPGKKRRPLESKGKVSPPSGARKKESPDKKTRDSPARPIPLEKLLGWPSENGNGNNGIGCSGIASRRESVFDDYNFSLWENEFKLNRNDGKERGSKRQDSTGLEYYLDVDQLLNVPLAATEPEVKYVSAKEIMDTFNREMDSPEKSSDKESESKGEKASKSDSLDDSLLGAVGGASIPPIDEALVEEATGSSQTVIETKNKGPDLWADDLFTDAFQSKARMGSKFEPMNAPWVITEQRPMKSIASQEVCCKAAMSVSKPEEDIKLDNTSCVKAEETCTLGNEIEEVKKDAVMSAGMGEGIEIKSTDGESVGDQKQYGAISKKDCGADAKNRRFSSGGKVRNMIGIFEQQPGVTKSPARKELASHKDGDIEKRPETMFQEIRSADIKCMHGKLGYTEEGKVRLEIKEPMKMLSEETLKETTLAMSRSVDNSAGERGVAEAEAVRSTQLESSSIEKVAESAAAEQRNVQKEQLIDLEEAQRTEKRPPTLEDKRDDILSLTEEPVVGWEAIKVATEVENIILSTGNAVEQKRNVMGEVIILAEPDKKSGESGAHANTRVKTSESEVRRKEAERASYSSTKGSGSTDRVEEHLPEWEKLLDRSEIKEEPLTSRMERMSTSSSFEEYKSVVSEAYQFLEALRDTIDEDDEDKEALPGEEAKETGGKAEESVGGLGSEVEEYHPCEELPGGERETIPRGVEGAPTKGGQAEAQSSPSSPERCKTTESSTSSSPYSSLPTFADISSGILSSASSKDENSLKTEDGPSRRERTTHKTKDTRGYPKAEADGTTDGTPAAAGDILEEEMDSTTLAKMNVASRKEYWDRRLKRAQEKSKEPVTVGSKPSPLTLSGIVARGRMSFEKSKDEYSTSDSGGDGGKSSSESSPTSKGNQFSRRPKAVYSKGARSILPPKPVAKEPLELTLPSEEKEAARPMEGQSSESVERVSNQDIPKEIRIPSGQEKAESSRNLDDKEDLSHISVSKRREIWNQKVQKIPEDDSPPSSIEYRRTERRKSSKLESVEAISAETPLRRRSDVPPYTRELEEQSLSLDSSSVDDRVGKDLGIKKPPAIKTGGSVSQLAKLFSSPPPEPPPVRSRGIRPMSKVKYSRGPEAGSLSSKDESVDEPRGSAESSSSAASPKAKAIVKPATVEASITGSRSPSPGESLAKKITSDGRSVKKFSEDLRKTSYSPTSKSPRGVVDRSTFRTDSESSEIDNIASRRQKYLESVQQSLEGDDGRHEGTLKKSESEDSMKEHMRKKAVSEVRNIWEKRASLDGSSSSESMKRPGKVGTILRSPISNKKKVAQEESLAAMTNAGRSERIRATPLKGVSTVAGIEGKVDISQDMSVAQNKAASSAVPPSVAIEKGHSEDDHSTHIALRRKEAPMDAEKDSEPQIPLSTESAGGIVAGLSVQSSVLLHEERPSLKNEGKQVQGENTTAQLIQAKIENKIDSHDLSSEKMAEGSDQSGSLVARVETASAIKFVARGSTPQEKPKSPYGRGFTQQREGAARTEAKVPGDSTAQSTLKGRRHSCATVFSPPNKVDLSKTREKFGSVEEKMLEFQGHKVKRDSLEIRVTDDEDVCVMREVTSVPRFALKEKKMETHAEEDVDERQAGGRKAEGKVDDEEDGHKTPSPTAKGATKRRSLPQRTLSIQVSGIVASGRRRFESGKAVAEDMPTLAEEIAETANKSNDPATERSSEERKEIPCVEGAVKEQDEDRDRRGGTQDQEDGPKITGSNGRELYRAVPASVTVEGEHRVIGKEAVRSEARLSLEKTSPASRGGEGCDDGRSATSRRVSKGKAPPPARQPPPSAASSPDSESEGAAEAKLLGFLSTPAAQARRHSAVDVASLRSFTGGDAAGAPRMRRRGSGDLGSPSRLKNEDESKKRFTRARQFFETLERGNDSPPSPPQSAAEVSSSSATPLKAKDGKKKKSSREERTPMGTSSLGRRTGGTKYRPPVPRQAKDSSGSTTDSDKERKHRRKVRRTPSTHSAPGSDVDSSGSTPLNHPSLHRRKREREFVLRSQRFGGSEREVKVSERFNVMDLFRDVAGPGNGVSSGRATPLGIPHQAAVLAALRSVEDVRNCETTSPYDMYRPVEADNDCEPSASGTNASASASTNASANASANASGAEDEVEGASGAGGAVSDENANPGGEDEEGNITFGSPMTMCVKKEYQAEYPHLPITSPRHSRHRSSNTDLIPRNVLLQRDANENSPGKASRRSIAELF